MSHGTRLIHQADLDVQHRIGGGGFGEVYMAMWKGVPVAVKKLRMSVVCDNALRTLAAEARTLASLRRRAIRERAVSKPGNVLGRVTGWRVVERRCRAAGHIAIVTVY